MKRVWSGYGDGFADDRYLFRPQAWWSERPDSTAISESREEWLSTYGPPMIGRYRSTDARNEDGWCVKLSTFLSGKTIRICERFFKAFDTRGLRSKMSVPPNEYAGTPPSQSGRSVKG
jgi:hypothetical protein